MGMVGNKPELVAEFRDSLQTRIGLFSNGRFKVHHTGKGWRLDNHGDHRTSFIHQYCRGRVVRQAKRLPDMKVDKSAVLIAEFPVGAKTFAIFNNGQHGYRSKGGWLRQVHPDRALRLVLGALIGGRL